jgi:hypothetical protein
MNVFQHFQVPRSGNSRKLRVQYFVVDTIPQGCCGVAVFNRQDSDAALQLVRQKQRQRQNNAVESLAVDRFATVQIDGWKIGNVTIGPWRSCPERAAGQALSRSEQLLHQRIADVSAQQRARATQPALSAIV